MRSCWTWHCRAKAVLEILRRLREVSRVPILFVSQADSVETRLEVLQAGADDFLVKPVDLRKLQLRLENRQHGHGNAEHGRRAE